MIKTAEELMMDNKNIDNNWVMRYKLKKLLKYQANLEKWIENDEYRLKVYKKRLKQIKKQIEEVE